MRILVISFYFQPDLSAGSFRASALVRALADQIPAGDTIDVVTTLPNRYQSYKASAPSHEIQGVVQIHRFPLPHHASGMLDQSRAYMAYARQVLRFARGRRFDLVVATSGRLMSAVLAARVTKTQGARLQLDIRDIFVDTICDVLPRWRSWLIRPLFSQLERYAIRRANAVNLVSPGFGEYFTRRYPEHTFTYFPNGIDDEFLSPPRETRPAGHGKIKVLYAGNLGESQGLHAILPLLASLAADRMEFTIIGDGGRKAALRQALAAAKVTNVTLVDPLSRAALSNAYQATDVLFLHLNDRHVFRTVLPSKLFEYAATGKPIWAGVAGAAEDLIRREVANAAVFRPCDAGHAIEMFAQLTLQPTPRVNFVQRYSRVSIMRNFAVTILKMARHRGEERMP